MRVAVGVVVSRRRERPSSCAGCSSQQTRRPIGARRTVVKLQPSRSLDSSRIGSDGAALTSAVRNSGGERIEEGAGCSRRNDAHSQHAGSRRISGWAGARHHREGSSRGRPVPSALNRSFTSPFANMTGNLINSHIPMALTPIPEIRPSTCNGFCVLLPSHAMQMP